FVPEDETCFYLYRAASPDGVRDAARRADLVFERLSEVVWMRTTPRERDERDLGTVKRHTEWKARRDSGVEVQHNTSFWGGKELVMGEHDDIAGGRYSRRRFLGTVGAGAVAIGASGAVNVATGRAAVPAATPRRRSAHSVTTHFGRIFEGMRPFAAPGTRGLEAALFEIGSPGGILDARDPLERGPVQLITDPSASAHNPDNPDHTAGVTFMGQFMDHDMTFDVSSPLGRPASPERSPNG